MSVGSGGGAALDRDTTSSLADVVETVLDKGVVIDAQVVVGVIGIPLLEIDARVVVASVETYLRFAEAIDRLDITSRGESGLGGAVGALGGGAGVEDDYDYDRDDAGADRDRERSSGRRRAARRNGGR